MSRISLADLYGKPKVSGQFGIENEVEFISSQTPLFTLNADSQWSVKPDGSLLNGTEYILRRPMNNGPTMLKALKSLEETLTSYGGVLVPASDRSSVHLHNNVSKLYPKTVWSFVVLLWLMEETLQDIGGGNHRRGNHFCLGGRYADALFTHAITDVTSLGLPFKSYGSHGNKYCSINLETVYRFLSVENRMHEGTISADVILEWVLIHEHLLEMATELDDPVKIFNLFTSLDEMELANKFLPPSVFEKFPKITRVDPRTLLNIASVVYCVLDWSDWELRVCQRHAKEGVSNAKNAKLSTIIGTNPVNAVLYDTITQPPMPTSWHLSAAEVA